MSNELAYYGHFEQKRYPLADWIFGHRLHIGQHWMEYLLEFLNVMAGFKYQLGQGGDCSENKGYARYARYGLRRFIFYDNHEKSKNIRDDIAIQKLYEELEARVLEENNLGSDTPLDRARELLRSYSAIEETRSWYAKSLFPAHEKLLFWEALRTKDSIEDFDGSTPVVELDKGMSLGARNFFARGGEIFYLILSAGTEADQDLRAFIEDRIQELLTERNKAIGRLAGIIDETWQDLSQDKQDESDEFLEENKEPTFELGWLPDPQCQLYSLIAQDVANILRAELDPLESLDLLAHLICFHLLIYIYHRAHPEHNSALCSAAQCLDICRPTLLVDCLEGQNLHIRKKSASLYKEWEQWQQQKARIYVANKIKEWAKQNENDSNNIDYLLSNAQDHFNIQSLHGKTLNPYDKITKDLIQKYNSKQIDQASFIEGYTNELTKLLLKGFQKQFIGIHRKLARSIGFIVPYQGPTQRYVLSDTLLKALSLANVSPNKSIQYDEFLNCFYNRYGLVIGQQEARISGLYSRKPLLNTEHYDKNNAALRDKLKNAGLLEEYSDATALVVNKFSRQDESKTE